MLTLDDFKKLRKIEHNLVVFDTDAGLYSIKNDNNERLIVMFTPQKSSGLILAERLTTVPVDCCVRHALLDAESFCYGNMSAWLSSAPNPRSPWYSQIVQ